MVESSTQNTSIQAWIYSKKPKSTPGWVGEAEGSWAPGKQLLGPLPIRCQLYSPLQVLKVIGLPAQHCAHRFPRFSTTYSMWLHCTWIRISSTVRTRVKDARCCVPYSLSVGFLWWTQNAATGARSLKHSSFFSLHFILLSWGLSKQGWCGDQCCMYHVYIVSQCFM